MITFFAKELESGKQQIKQLRADLALSHSGHRMLKEEIVLRAREIAELREEIRKFARELNSPKREA